MSVDEEANTAVNMSEETGFATQDNLPFVWVDFPLARETDWRWVEHLVIGSFDMCKVDKRTLGVCEIELGRDGIFGDDESDGPDFSFLERGNQRCGHAFGEKSASDKAILIALGGHVLCRKVRSGGGVGF